MTSRLFFLALVSLTLLLGCGGESFDDTGAWRAVATLPGGELPFGVQIAKGRDGGLTAVVQNGAERVEVPDVRWANEVLHLDFPAFNTRITLMRDGADLQGTLTLIKRGGVEQTMPLRLTRGASYRFVEGNADVNADFGGRWSATFVDEDGVETPAIGEFEQTNGVVTGTFRTPTGDYRYLAGEVVDKTLYLSTFDGAHAFLFVAEQGNNGMVSGDFWSGTAWHERFDARRDATAALPDPDDMSSMREGAEKVVFAFPDTDGQIVSHDDPRFANKVMIVALAGSWCPNCHDEAAFLAPFFEARRERGLAVVGLMFEHLPGFDDAAVQVRRFREKFDIGYELLVAGYSDKEAATATLGLLDEVIAYPTMIVLDRSGVVRRIHTGFNGPGTGVHYDEFREEFTAFIDGLLAEGES